MKLEHPAEQKWECRFDPQDAERQSRDHGQEEPKRGEHEPLDYHDASDVAARHAYRTDHTELTAELEDTRPQRIGHPDEHDDEHEGAQHIDDAERPAHLSRVVVHQLG